MTETARVPPQSRISLNKPPRTYTVPLSLEECEHHAAADNELVHLVDQSLHHRNLRRDLQGRKEMTQGGVGGVYIQQWPITRCISRKSRLASQ